MVLFGNLMRVQLDLLSRRADTLGYSGLMRFVRYGREVSAGTTAGLLVIDDFQIGARIRQPRLCGYRDKPSMVLRRRHPSCADSMHDRVFATHRVLASSMGRAFASGMVLDTRFAHVLTFLR